MSVLLNDAVIDSLEVEPIELGVAVLLVVLVSLRGGGVVTRWKPKQLPGICPTIAT